MIRSISLKIRTWNDKKSLKQTLKKFNEWSAQIRVNSPKEGSSLNKIAIIRLDDIGDYILFRNFLKQYRQSAKYRKTSITLVGNFVWKEIFEEFDSKYVDNTIWIKKGQYFNDSEYRDQILTDFASTEFDEIICPSRTRPILLDDLLTQANKSPVKKGCKNNHQFPKMNAVSDKIYTHLFKLEDQIHEFSFNQKFTNWILEENNQTSMPSIPINKANQTVNKAMCFIGASAKSKRWPEKHWVSLIKKLQSVGYSPVIAGGKQDCGSAKEILRHVSCESIVGETSLLESIRWISDSKFVVSGDTMAVHIAAATRTETIILSNGINASRFVDYRLLKANRIHTIYTKQYLNFRLSEKNQINFSATSHDMASIKPFAVFKKIEEQISIKNEA